MTLALDACFAEGRSFDLQAEVSTTSGKRQRVRSLGEALRHSDGRAAQIHGVLQHASLNQQAERAASQIALRLNTTLDSISEAFMTLHKVAATANAALNIELRQGLCNYDFRLHYQPWRMSGVEALVRWQHPQCGLVFPQEFIFQAE